MTEEDPTDQKLSAIIYNLQTTISNVVQLFKISVDSIYSNHIYYSSVAIGNGRTTHRESLPQYYCNCYYYNNKKEENIIESGM